MELPATDNLVGTNKKLRIFSENGMDQPCARRTEEVILEDIPTIDDIFERDTSSPRETWLTN